MRYIKVLFLVLVFFLCMVFFFQNQESLSKEMVLRIHLFFTPPMTSIALPLYFVVLTSFLTGAILALLMLAWDKMHISARLMKSTWRVRSLEKEVEQLKTALGPSAERGFKLFSRSRKEEKPADKPAAPAVADAPAPTPETHA